MRQPDFANLLAVLKRQVPRRPTLFEFFLNSPLYERLAGPRITAMKDVLAPQRIAIHAYRNAGYDYVTVQGSDFAFPAGQAAHLQTRSLNEGALISDRASFERYPWPDPETRNYSRLAALETELPPGMKLIVWGPGGVLENAISLVGYDRLCLLLYDDPDLVQDIFAAIGSRFVKYYARCAPYPTVGALISNDDWGFKTQTMLAPAEMRRYVFPWHRRIVETCHAAGKPVILHSCGELKDVMEDVIEDMRYDAKHSYEDAILPVEEAYERWGHRIAILGGIDLDFIVRSTPAAITRRSRAMLERAAKRGSYALGTGNSVPEYIPQEHYFAMTAAADVDPPPPPLA